ncbi:MAG: hypothetical protein Q9227_000784 [Pyrenula ochraceoflavens]
MDLDPVVQQDPTPELRLFAERKKLMATVGHLCLELPKYVHACKMLGIDPNTRIWPHNPELVLKPHQIQGIVFLLERERTIADKRFRRFTLPKTAATRRRTLLQEFPDPRSRGAVVCDSKYNNIKMPRSGA